MNRNSECSFASTLCLKRYHSNTGSNFNFHEMSKHSPVPTFGTVHSLMTKLNKLFNASGPKAFQLQINSKVNRSVECF